MSEALVNTLRSKILDVTSDMDPSVFQIRGLWKIDLICRPSLDEQQFSYGVYVVQTQRQGACYCHLAASDLPVSLMGADARLAESGFEPLDIAILDAAYSATHQSPVSTRLLEGTPAVKALQRARIIVDEVLAVSPSRAAGRPVTVAVIGAIGTVMGALRDAGCNVLATDLHKAIVGQRLHDVRVDDGAEYSALHVARADVAVLSGMTLATGTLGELLTAAEQSDTRVVIVAETGAWFAAEYCNSFGVDVVVAEPFPFYIFEGATRLFVYRRPPR
jgi:hypothetical protein